ncbi:hypothetical protein DB41_JE00050 [Neochlamydia sp. TUME1]|nr:hypothetical protein DB41_JE00050 [Neochlamydia sp. TUME1]
MGDEVYGAYPLRAYLGHECCPYILAVLSNFLIIFFAEEGRKNDALKFIKG